MSTDLRPGGVAALVLAGLFAGALVGPLAAGCCAAAAIACLAAPALRQRLRSWPMGATTVGVVAALGGGALLGVAPQELLVGLLAWLQVHRRWSRAGAGDDRVSVLLAGMTLLVAAGRVDDPVLALPVATWWLGLPLALSTARIRPRGAALLVGVVLVCGAGAFVAAPRLAADPRPRDLTGFAPRVELGEIDDLLDDPAVVFHATLSPPPGAPVYWRGVALDTFDGRRWSSGSAAVPVDVVGPRTLPSDASVVEVRPEDEGGVLFTTGRVVDLQLEHGTALGDGQGGWRASQDPGRYRLVTLPPYRPSDPPRDLPTESDPDLLARAVTLPEGYDRVRELAAQVAGDGPPASQIEHLAAWLGSTFTYTRRPGGRGLEAPLQTFLFETRAGHCEYFASALAVLARARGIPARVVNGFVGGELDPDTGWWTIRRYHAHSWTEVYLGGWVAVDSTPGASAVVAPPRTSWWLPAAEGARGAWRRTVDYDRADQAAALWSMSRRVEGWIPTSAASPRLPWRGLVLVAALGLCGVLVARLAARRLAHRLLDASAPASSGPVERAHQRARRHLATRGIRAPTAMPPVEAARHIAREHPGDAADALLDLAWLHYEVRLGGADPRAAAPRARELADRVCRSEPA